MADLAEARMFALSLPRTTEEPHHEMTSFRVNGKIFATAPPDQEHLHVFVDEAEVQACVAENPAAYEELTWGKRLAGVRVVLAAAQSDRVAELLEDAWRRKAPKTVAADFDARMAER